MMNLVDIKTLMFDYFSKHQKVNGIVSLNNTGQNWPIDEKIWYEKLRLLRKVIFNNACLNYK